MGGFSLFFRETGISTVGNFTGMQSAYFSIQPPYPPVRAPGTKSVPF